MTSAIVSCFSEPKIIFCPCMGIRTQIYELCMYKVPGDQQVSVGPVHTLEFWFKFPLNLWQFCVFYFLVLAMY